MAEKARREHVAGASNLLRMNSNTQAVRPEWKEQETVLKKDSPEDKHHFGSQKKEVKASREKKPESCI